MVEPGQIVAGKFQIERVLGQGGMGLVVAAQHLQLGQLVALKFLLPEAMRNPETAERFLREARATVRLKSDHVGRVIDVGTLDNGAPYIVMEYLDGEDLHQFRARHTRLPVAQAVDYVLQASEAVAEAHCLGIIHRDLKPANLFLTVSAEGLPWVKVLDFGISKATGAHEDFSLTRTATVMGSPGYMSPEQLRSAKDVDARSDVWALGVILYELVTGATPFLGDSITELTIKVVMDPTPPMSVPVPPGFEAVVGRCLAKNPDDRFGSVAELAAALAPFGPPGANELALRIARVQAGLSTNLRRSAIASAMVPTTLGGSVGQTASRRAHKTIGFAVVGGLALVAAIVVAIIVGSGGNQPTAPATQPAADGLEASDAGAAAALVAPDAGSGPVSGSGSVTEPGTGSGSVPVTAAGSGSGSDPGSGAGSGSSKRRGKPGKGSGSDFGNSRF